MKAEPFSLDAMQEDDATDEPPSYFAMGTHVLGLRSMVFAGTCAVFFRGRRLGIVRAV